MWQSNCTISKWENSVNNVKWQDLTLNWVCECHDWQVGGRADSSSRRRPQPSVRKRADFWEVGLVPVSYIQTYLFYMSHIHIYTHTHTRVTERDRNNCGVIYTINVIYDESYCDVRSWSHCPASCVPLHSLYIKLLDR